MSALNIMDLGIASSNATGELVELLRRRRINSSILELAPWALSEPTCRQHRRTQVSCQQLICSWWMKQVQITHDLCYLSLNCKRTGACTLATMQPKDVHSYTNISVQPKIKFQILTSSLSNRVIMRTAESFCRLSPSQEPTRPWSVNQKRNMSHIINTNGTR